MSWKTVNENTWLQSESYKEGRNKMEMESVHKKRGKRIETASTIQHIIFRSFSIFTKKKVLSLCTTYIYVWMDFIDYID